MELSTLFLLSFLISYIVSVPFIVMAVLSWLNWKEQRRMLDNWLPKVEEPPSPAWDWAEIMMGPEA